MDELWRWWGQMVQAQQPVMGRRPGGQIKIKSRWSSQKPSPTKGSSKSMKKYWASHRYLDLCYVKLCCIMSNVHTSNWYAF